MHNEGLGSAEVIDENLWNPRRLGVPSVNKTAQAVVRRPLRECYNLYGKCIRRLWDLIGNENPRRTSFSVGQIEISALGVALANNNLVALLNFKRTRMDNL